jgi:hypothetical protein
VAEGVEYAIQSQIVPGQKRLHDLYIQFLAGKIKSTAVGTEGKTSKASKRNSETNSGGTLSLGQASI